jgi:hypothetical protein
MNLLALENVTSMLDYLPLLQSFDFPFPFFTYIQHQTTNSQSFARKQAFGLQPAAKACYVEQSGRFSGARRATLWTRPSLMIHHN